MGEAAIVGTTRLPEYRPYDDKPKSPWASIRRDRQAGDVHFVEDHGFFQVYGYDAIQAAVRAPDIFSNRFGVTGSTSGETAEFLSYADPPIHTSQRRLMNAAFSRRHISRLKPFVAQLANDLVDRMLERGEEVDLLVDFAVPFPITVICQMLGVPEADRHRVKDWSDESVVGAATLSNLPREVREANLMGYIAELVAARRKAADYPEDLIAALMTAEIDGRSFTDDEVVAAVRLLLVAGNETTTNLIGNTVVALHDAVAERAKLLADPKLVASAVEEGLRFDGPIHGLFRTALSDTELAGTHIPAGSRVLNLYGAASHDPRKYDEPDRYIIGRNWTDGRTPRHLGFGDGIHVCLGGNLARLETQIALDTLYRRLPTLSLREDWDRRQRPGFFFRGWTSVPVTFA